MMKAPDAPPLEDCPLATAVPEPLPRLDGYTFEGYRNADGSVGTKNILGISTTVQCVAATVDYAVKRIKAEMLPRYPTWTMWWRLRILMGAAWRSMRRARRFPSARCAI
jgi:galactarate dehydratase